MPTRQKTGNTMASRLSITIIGVLFAATTAASLAAQDLYVGDFGKAKILKISPEGAVEIYAAPITAPNQMAFDASGNLYVAGGTAIWKIAPPQGGAAPVVSKIFEGDPLRNARALTIDPDGNFWVSSIITAKSPTPTLPSTIRAHSTRSRHRVSSPQSRARSFIPMVWRQVQTGGFI